MEAQPRIAHRVAATIGRFSTYGSVRDCIYAPRAVMGLGDQVEGHAVLAVVHSVSRGTKKAVDDAIFEAGASNLGSMHQDFPNDIAYDVSFVDRPLKSRELQGLVRRAADLAQDPRAIRSIRQIEVPLVDD